MKINLGVITKSRMSSDPSQGILLVVVPFPEFRFLQQHSVPGKRKLCYFSIIAAEELASGTEPATLHAPSVLLQRQTPSAELGSRCDADADAEKTSHRRH